MLHISGTIVVEGRYDKARLSNLVDCPIIVANGFGVFKDMKTCELLRFYSENGGILILTDSDSAGFRIRGHIKSIVPTGDVRCAYIPDIYGKEKRKLAPSAEGKLGVEGMPDDVLIRVLTPFSDCEKGNTGERTVTKLDLYDDGFVGGQASSEKRRELLKLLNLPERLTTNGLLDAVNRVCGYDEYRAAADKIIKGSNQGER